MRTLWKTLWSVARYLLLGPKTPAIKEYLHTLKSAALEPRTDRVRTIFHESEQRMHNHLISVIYYKSEHAETVDLHLYGKHGGVAFTVSNGKVSTLTKDGITFHDPALTTANNYALFQILNILRKAFK